MQNKPNPKTPKPNLTPYPKKHYARISPLRPQKNKPNSNPIPNTPSAPRPALPNNQSKTLSPKSAQILLSEHTLSAKTSQNQNSFAQNKPNPKKKQTQNKPNPNPIKPNFPPKNSPHDPIFSPKTRVPISVLSRTYARSRRKTSHPDR